MIIQDKPNTESRMNHRTLFIFIVLLFAVQGMLLQATVATNKYSFYIILRCVCFFAFTYTSICYYRTATALCVFPIILAFIYNPIIPLRFSKPIWILINEITIGIVAFMIAISIYAIIRRAKKSSCARNA